MGSLPPVGTLGGLGGYAANSPIPASVTPTSPALAPTAGAPNQNAPASPSGQPDADGDFDGSVPASVLAAAPSATPAEVAASSKNLPLAVLYAPSSAPHEVEGATFDKSA
jgi:hypothetical protein